MTDGLAGRIVCGKVDSEGADSGDCQQWIKNDQTRYQGPCLYENEDQDTVPFGVNMLVFVNK